MRCDSTTLSAYVFGELDPAQSKAVEMHVETCQACAQRLARLRNAAALLETAPEAENEPVDMAHLRAAIASSRLTANRFSWIREWLMPRRRHVTALAAATCLILLVLHYGVSLRIGRFEVAFGPQKSTAPAPKQVAVVDEAVIHRIARQEIAREVTPTLVGFARQISDLTAGQREAIVNLRSDFARQRALDQGEVRRNIRFIAESMSEAVRQRQ
jgi:anti-sigma factor RsiW